MSAAVVVSGVATAAVLAATTGLQGPPGPAAVSLVADVSSGAYGPVDKTGAVDSSAAFQAAVNALAGTGVGLWIPAGTYKIATPIQLVSNLTIIGTPSTRVISNVGTGSNQFATFIAQPGAVLSTTTTAAQANVGSKTFSSTASIPVGTPIRIDVAANLSFIYITTAVNGAGPYTVTIDRPLKRTVPNASAVTLLASVPTNIHIYGRGMSFSGVCSRHIEMLETRDCYVDECSFDCANGAWVDTAFSWDTASYRGVFKRMIADGPGAGFGTTGESSEYCSWIDCAITNVSATYGFHQLQTTDSIFEGCSASGCLVGLRLDSSLGATQRSSGAKLTNCRFDSNTEGVELVHAENCRILNTSADNNGDYGFEHLTSGVGNHLSGSSRNNVSGGLFVGSGAGALELGDLNADNNVSGILAQGPIKATKVTTRFCTNGVQLQAGADGSIFGEVDVSECTSGGFVSSVDCEIGRFYSVSIVNNSGYLGILSGTPDVIVRSGYISMNPPGATSIGCVYAAAGRMFLSGLKILGRLNVFGIEADNGATINISDTVVSKIGAATGTSGVIALAGGTVKIGPNVDLTNTATPITATGTVTMSQGAGSFVGTQAAAGTKTLTQVEAKADGIRSTIALTGNVRYDVPAGVPGLAYDVENLTSGAFTLTVGVTGGTGIAVASGKRARVRSDGTNMQRVSPDT